MIESKPEVSVPTAACPEPHRWRCYDACGTEVEVLKLLNALVVALKPRVIVETGCYFGYGTEALAAGTVVNGFGEIWSCDIGFDMIARTQQHLSEAKLGARLFNCSGEELIKQVPGEIDFAFLDSGSDGVRCEELKVLLPKLSRSGVVVIHDVGLQHGLREHFFRTVKDLDLEFISFDTLRGLAIARKRWQTT